VKNCDLGIENVALDLLPWEAFSRPQSQFFTIRISQPANDIYTLAVHRPHKEYPSQSMPPHVWGLTV